MQGEHELPDAYLVEKVRAAIASEAHALDIDVLLTADEARLEGRVETAEQRERVEAAARGVLGGRRLENRIEVVVVDARIQRERLP